MTALAHASYNGGPLLGVRRQGSGNEDQGARAADQQEPALVTAR